MDRPLNCHEIGIVSPPADADTTHMTDVYGCDFSRWHPVGDGAPFRRAGHQFGYAKVSEGATGADMTWKVNRDRLRAVGIPVGGYHFYRHSATPQQNADNFVRNYGDPTLCALPPCLDAEDPAVRCSPTQVADELAAFLVNVEGRLGRTAMVYTGAWWWTPHCEPRPLFANRPLWVSGYSARAPIPKPWTDYAMWQYTDAGTVPGGGVFDMSRTTEVALRQLLRINVTTVTAPPSTPVLMIGDHGPHVAELQLALNYGTGAQLAGDGMFGVATANAVRNVQSFCRLTPVDGVYGPSVQWVLQVACNAKAAH